METWYLIIILGSGGYQTGSSQQTVEFKNEAACIEVMEHLSEKYDSENNTIICVKDQ